MQETQEAQIWSLGQEDSLEKEMAAHPSILAWEIPWTEETSGQQSVGLQRVGHNLAAEQVSGFSFLSLFLSSPILSSKLQEGSLLYENVKFFLP